MKLAPGLDVQSLGRVTAGMTGADIAAIVNTAAIQAVLRNTPAVNDRS